MSDSPNPQTLFCGTPPTAVSKGHVFEKMRTNVLSGSQKNSGWAEWSVDHQTDVHDVDYWYECNPAMGFQLNERKVEDEIGSDLIDFNIQRLGWWATFNQKSAININDWNKLKVEHLPKFKGQLFVGVKYGKGTNNVAMSIAVKTEDDKVFVESIDCRDTREGNSWIIDFIVKADVGGIVVDGIAGQSIIQEEFKANKIKKYTFPSVKEVIEANATFEHCLMQESICHANQPSLAEVVTNCEKRAIGSNGGFGFKAIKEHNEVALMDSMIFAHWMCSKQKEKKSKRSYGY